MIFVQLHYKNCKMGEIKVEIGGFAVKLLRA